MDINIYHFVLVHTFIAAANTSAAEAVFPSTSRNIGVWRSGKSVSVDITPFGKVCCASGLPSFATTKTTILPIGKVRPFQSR